MKHILLKMRRVFLAGFFVCLPLVITILVFRFAFRTLDSLGPTVTQALIQVGAPIPHDFQIPGLGVVTTLTIVFLIGIVTTNYLGKKLWKFGEDIVTRIPVIRSVYTGAKQVIDTFATNTDKAFTKVVMLEYPRAGIYCLAFITGTTRGEAQDITGENLINIFLPTTPNPTSGFFLMVPKEDLTEMNMTVEDGIKMVISGGVVTPNGGKYLKKDGNGEKVL